MDMRLADLKKLTCLRQGEKKVCENCFCPIPTAGEANLTRRIMGLLLMMCTTHVRVKAIEDKSSINITYTPHPHPHMMSPSCASGPSWLHPPQRCSAECLNSAVIDCCFFFDALLNYRHKKWRLDIFLGNQWEHWFIVTGISKEFCR